MGWELVGKPQTVKVTAKIAKEFADMDAAHVDRPLKERRLQVYRKVREQGGFRPVTWAKAWCQETDQYYRVNGKHTSTLFSDGEKLDGIYAVVEEYVCDTMEDVAKLYATFDSQIQSRDTNDINRSFAAVIPELADMDGKMINLLVGAIAYHAYPGTSGAADGKTPAERAEALFDNIEFCVWASDILAPNERRETMLRRVPVVAAMRGCWEKSRSAATEFWKAVLLETGTKPDLPDRKLARFLTQTRLTNATAAVPKRFKLSPREFYVKSIKAWNAWRKNEPTDLKYYVEVKIPAFA